MTATPSLQSVVVPVEPTREMLNAAIDVDSFKLGDISPLGFRISPQMLFKKCWSAMLSAAPAPSSLAGGEVREVMISLGWSVVESRGYGLICWGWSAPCEDGGESHKRRDWTEEQAWADAEQVFNRRVERARVILAALSPEAPAREGVSLVLDQAPNFGFETNEPAPRQMIEHYYRSHGMENWQRLADQYCAALTPRHEAPASHAFEASHSVHREGGCKVCGHDEASHEAPAEGAGERDARAAINSLTRSVENFDNGYEWGCDPVAVRAILRHLRARSSAPEAREREEAVAWMRLTAGRITHLTHCEMPGYVPLYTHPAAPSGDHAELAACPFCDGKATLHDGMGEFWVRCDDCDASGSMRSMADRAVRDWNDRTPQAALLSEIAALRGDLTETRVAADLLVSSVRADLRQAERQRDELRRALETIGEMAPATCETSLAHDMAQHANQALANQGADQ